MLDFNLPCQTEYLSKKHSSKDIILTRITRKCFIDNGEASLFSRTAQRHEATSHRSLSGGGRVHIICWQRDEKNNLSFSNNRNQSMKLQNFNKTPLKSICRPCQSHMTLHSLSAVSVYANTVMIILNRLN